MTGRRPSMTLVAVLAGCVTMSMAACTATYDASLVEDTTVAATTTTLPVGTTDELLARLLDEATALSGIMAEDGDRRAALERIELLWGAAEPGVRATRADLVPGFERAIAMCQRAVQYQRAADADKAARNIASLVEVVTA
ncbi:MAG: hypothetical protein RI958_501 [Actinomycetota bacterium]|jgi:hypothetical protein